jgi:hypothetical protein
MLKVFSAHVSAELITEYRKERRDMGTLTDLVDYLGQMKAMKK